MDILNSTIESKINPHQDTQVEIGIEGISPLLMHAWSKKALRMLEMTPAERKKQPKEKRTPEATAKECAYYTDDGSYGLPLVAFKAALINVAHKDEGIEKTLVRKSVFIPSTDSNMCVPLSFDKEPYVRTDTVRVGAGSTDLRYRLCFESWRATFQLCIDTSRLSVQDVVILANKAGFSTGIGDWRPEKGGEMGRFRVDTSVPVTESRTFKEVA